MKQETGLKSFQRFRAIQSRFFVAAIAANVFFLLPGMAPNATAFSATDATTIWNSFNRAFYVANDGNAFYRDVADSGPASFWNEAEEIEMALDRYNASHDKGDLQIVVSLLNGFEAARGSNWATNGFNDDIMWACIAFARGFEATGNPHFKEIAKANFDIVYNRACDTNLGGGLWWTTDNHSKNACVNGPGAIAAYLIYSIDHDSNYLVKAQGIYDWEKSHLLDPSGRVYDNERVDGSFGTRAYSYNAGTFVGAANFLGDFTNASLVAQYVMHEMSYDGVLPGSGVTSGDGAGFNGICLRWIARFVTNCNLQATYSAWLSHNAENAWDFADPTNGLSWCNWRRPTILEDLHAFGCAGSVVALQIAPPHSFNPSAVMLTNGNFQLFCIHSSGGLVDAFSSVPEKGSLADGWRSLGGTMAKVVAAQNADGTMQLFALGFDQSIYTAYRSNSTWTDWQTLNGSVWDFCVATNANGALRLFGNATSGNIATTSQRSPNEYANWSRWTNIAYTGGSALGIAATAESNGDLHAFSIGTNGTVFHTYQNSDHSWSAPVMLGKTATDIAISKWPDGRLELFVACPDGSLQHAGETAPNQSSNWTSWERLGNSAKLGCTRVVASTQKQNGNPIVFYLGKGNSVRYFACDKKWPRSPKNIGGNVDNLVVGIDLDGALELFGTGPDSTVLRNRQQGNKWSGWESIGGNVE